MLWECSILNKIYKTLEFKVNPPNFPKLSNTIKPTLMEKIKNSLEEYNLSDYKSDILFNLNIQINPDCALYHLYPNNTTYYFSFFTNYCYFHYLHFLQVGRNINKDKDNKEITSEELIPKWEIYLTHLLFIKELNLTKFQTELENNLNIFFKYNSFILNTISYFDLILYSIIFSSPLYKTIIHSSDEKYKYIKRWCIFQKNYYDINEEKFEKFYQSREKEYLYNTYKLTSSSEIIEALLNKNYPLLEECLSIKHLNVESRKGKEYKTLAHISCSRADKEALNILLKYNCNMESLDFENMTPLYDAIYSCDISFVDYLLNTLKVNINHREIQNRSPFYWASCTCNLAMMKYLLKIGNIDINQTSLMGRGPLSKACWNGRDDIVKLLCEQKNIKVNLPDNNNRYPIHNACWGAYGGRQGKKMSGGEASDSPKSVEILIEHGADFEVKDNEGNTPFMIATSTSGIQSMKILYKYGAKINLVNIRGESGLIQAVQYGNWESILCLVDIDKSSKNYNNNNNNLCKKEVVDFDLKDNFGFKAIDHAVIYRRVLCLKILFEYCDYLYNNEIEILKLINESIKSGSALCFEYLFRKFLVVDKVNDYNENVRKIIEKCLLIGELRCFNIVYEREKKLKDIILEDNHMKIFFFLFQRYNELSDVEDIKNDESIIEKDSIYEHILSLKMNEVEEENYYIIDDNWSEKDLLKEKGKFKFYFKELLEYIIQNNCQKDTINSNLMKTLIIFDDIIDFNSLIKSHENENNQFLKYEKLILDKKILSYFEIQKHGIKEINDENSIWKDLIFNFNSNYLLSLSIKNPNKEIFDKIIIYKEIKKEIFEHLPETNKNILHVLFEEDRKERFDKIIQIILEENKDNSIIENKFLPMINEIDINSLTPLDSLLKGEDLRNIEYYTDTLTQIKEKYCKENSLINTKIKTYILLNFDIIKSEISIDKSYNEFLKSQIKKCKSKRITKNKKIDYEEIYSISKYYIDKESISNISYIINKYLSEEIEKEFLISNKNYIHSFIDNEEDLIKICNEIKEEKVLGIDTEFDGDNCEIDGIICVIQISSMKKTYAIDSLKLRNEIIKYIKPIFENENIVKIFHGCDNDLFWLLTNFEITTKNIFDTARAFNEFQTIILRKTFKIENLSSLYHLVKFFLNVKLDKSYQRSNWRIRPLTINMYQYSLNDAKSVIYLYYIFQGLYLYLNKIQIVENDVEQKQIEDYYKGIYKKFFLNLNESENNLNEIEVIYSLIKISLKCNEMIEQKLKEKYTKLDIKLK